jgi:hypothetical protein
MISQKNGKNTGYAHSLTVIMENGGHNMAEIAVTVTAYILIPRDDFDDTLSEVMSNIELAIQKERLTYAMESKNGIPGEMSDRL